MSRLPEGPLPDSTSPPSPTPLRWTRRTWIGVGSLLAIHSLLLGGLAALYSPTWNEPGHLAAGYRIWTTGRADLYTVNPPLVKTVAAWPLLFFQPKTNWSLVVDAPGYRPEFATGRLFLQDNPETWYGMLLLARWACIPLSLLGAIIAFRWAREVFGETSGWIALVLWTFDPNILGNGCLIAPDLGGSSLGSLAGYLFWRWLDVSGWERATLAGLGLGLALLSKSTLLVFGPLWIAVWIVNRLHRGTLSQTWQREVKQLAVLLLLSGYVLNLGYGFSGTGTKLKEFEFVSQALGGDRNPGQTSSNRFRGTVLEDLPSPVPSQFLLGIDLQKKDFEVGRWTFLAGRWKWGGWPYFYLVAIAIKSPLGYGLLLLMALRVVWRSGPGIRQSVFVIGLPLLTILGFVSMEQGFTTCVRYVLPALPFSIVLLASVGRWVETGSQWARYGMGVTLAWIVTSSLCCLPFSLSYFNELVGGPAHGYQYLFDANVDWSQDLYFVKDWVKRHPEARPVTLSWYEIFDSGVAGLNLPATPVPTSSHSPEKSVGSVEGQSGPQAASLFEGWHLVSVHNLQSADQRFSYLRELEPVDRIGYSVMVYHLDAAQAERARTRVGTPLVPPKSR